MELDKLFTLMAVLFGWVISAIGAWIAVKVNMATVELRLSRVEDSVRDQHEWKERLVDTLQAFNVVLTKLDERLDGLIVNVNRLERRIEKDSL